MMRTRGHDLSAAELNEQLNSLDAARREWEAIAGDKDYGRLWILRQLSPNRVAANYSAEQLAAWDRVLYCQRTLQPALDRVDAYRRVMTVSLANSALSSLPVLPSHFPAFDLNSGANTTDRMPLLKITCKELQRVPVCKTLKETIRLASTPEAQALRQKLGEWANSWRTQDVNMAEKIEREVRLARKSLESSKTLNRYGELVTCVGGTLSILGAMSTMPLVGPLGGSVAVMGFVLLGGEKAFKFQHKWAMFG
jgi:hypothetical protein